MIQVVGRRWRRLARPLTICGVRVALISLVVVLGACGPGVESESASVERSALSGTWQSLGTGVTMLDTGNPLGANVFIGYAGYNINLGQAQSWVGALTDERLHQLGVRYVIAVQGPADPGYNALEIANSRIVATLHSLEGPQLGFVLVAGHSSGSFVADELLQQLDTGNDPFNSIGSRLVFFDLDGDQKYVSASGINRLRRAYYVNGFNPATGVSSWNHGAMNSLGAAFAGKGGALEYDARSSGCTAGGCVHISLINRVPHDPNGGSGVDYADFGGRGVNTWWLDVKREEAGLGQCTTAFLTEGLIQARYEAMGGCGSVLGAPTTNMVSTADGRGRYNQFEFGSIYWSFFTGAHDVRGAIRAKWEAANFENGPLGYPTSDELVTQDTLGRYNVFEHGAVYWSFGTGAHVVLEPVLGAWAARNYENGALGYPIGDTHAVSGGVQSEFQHGVLLVKADGSVVVTLEGADAGVPHVVVVSEVDAGLVVGAVAAPVESAAPTGSQELPGVVGGCSVSGGAAWALGLIVLLHRRQRS